MMNSHAQTAAVSKNINGSVLAVMARDAADWKFLNGTINFFGIIFNTKFLPFFRKTKNITKTKTSNDNRNIVFFIPYGMFFPKSANTEMKNKVKINSKSK